MRMISMSRRITYCEMISVILEVKLEVEKDIPFAVNTFSLVLANDDVTESSTVLKDEDSVLLTALNLVVACAVTTVILGSYQRYTHWAQQTFTQPASKVWPFLMYCGALRDLVPVCLGRPPVYAKQAKVEGRAARMATMVEECILKNDCN